MKITPGALPLASARPPKSRPVTDAGESPEAKRARLKKATQEFESFFVLYMLKAMRKTVPENTLLSGGLGQDIYTSLFDEELSKKVASGSTNSLSDLLFESLSRRLEAEEAGAGAGAAKVPPSQKIDVGRRPPSGSKIHPASEATVSGQTSTGLSEPLPKVVPAYRETRPRIVSDPVLKKYGPTIKRAARQYGVDPQLIYSVIMTESGGDPAAISPKGAKGLMQLTDDTASDMGVADSLNPHQNIIGGTKYLRKLLDQFDGDLKLTLAAYNAGPGTVSKYNGVPPFEETQEYIGKVLDQLYGPKK